MSGAKANLGTSEQVSEGDRKFVEQLAIYDQVMDCVLWRPESDFSKACSCDQCRPKIARLMQFEKEIQAKKRLLGDYHSETNDKEDLCLGIFTCVNWTKWLSIMFLKNLKAVCKESRVTVKLEKCSVSRLETLDKQLFQKLIEHKFVGPPDEKDQDRDAVDSEDSTTTDSYHVLKTLRHGYYHYGKTKAKYKALDIIKNIEKIENDHDMDKKIAEAQKTSIDPAVSKNYLEKQIELVEELPVDELLYEFNELIGNMRPRDYLIEFWQGAPSLATEGSDHNSNGLNETLDSLIYEVKSFEDQWRDDYADFFTPHDRSNPKRQATS
ncbi:hypothetical protein CASFOL_003324 [Castilleja foliolosa]|uniref:Uncharacterized protein n=1 Tax=Castilleja foliolosa TaxID=1961234 RepID=A0ABD3EH53_9LAMI